MMQRYLDPRVLAGISGLDLVAKTVVDGFIAGLHRSPEHGFSQEFSEYRPYTPGDDLRSVDWNVFGRTEKLYLKRYKGETNTQLTVLLDASASMGYSSARVSKLEYAKFLAASLCYLAHRQRDAAGLLVFDDQVRACIPPSTRQGQMARLLHAVANAQPQARTDFSAPFVHMQNLLHRRGLIAVISDFYEQPEKVMKTMAPLAFRGSELILFHVLDPNELAPDLDDAALLTDAESGDSIPVTPDYARNEYPRRMRAHIEALEDSAKTCGIDYCLLTTGRPLDDALREYLFFRSGPRTRGLSRA